MSRGELVNFVGIHVEESIVERKEGRSTDALELT
jgi:hypothetical protein